MLTIEEMKQRGDLIDNWLCGHGGGNIDKVIMKQEDFNCLMLSQIKWRPWEESIVFKSIYTLYGIRISIKEIENPIATSRSVEFNQEEENERD